MPSRRDFLRRAAALSAATLAYPLHGQGAPRPLALDLGPDPTGSLPRHHPGGASGDRGVRDEAYWREVARRYRVTDEVTNLEGGFFGTMPEPVLAAYHENVDRVNRENAWFARTRFPAMAQEAREQTAAALGVDPGEIVFARNATEALQTLILQYNGVGPGDTVMYADLDYPAMQEAMRGLALRHGAEVATLDLPEPASREGILDAYREALHAHPRTRFLLLTHANNKTGLLHPVREIHALARERGVEVVVDAAHSFGQVPLSIPELGAPYVGVNLHKWVGAPVGVAAMYIRRDALGGIDRVPGSLGAAERIESRIQVGTMDFATLMTVPVALDFQDAIGVERKAARLRYLRDTWVLPAREIEGVDILTPDDPDLVGAITSFRLRGDGSPEGNAAVVRTLLEEFRIFTVARSGLARGDCVRVTPALHTTPDHTAHLVAALRELAGRSA
ncbi:MAG: aminotransferase class V-fold PLP-dependent enzyme [Gemmatimonadales bacterium]|nr:MAG: aminotransferase class V-fold PLP-dependent enzyme [Gemmatimonadales bacterium]